jgi:hypothetical protein
MTRRSASQPGMVVWLAGSEIDRFPSFDEYFMAMVDYDRLDRSYDWLAADSGPDLGFHASVQVIVLTTAG